MEQGGGVKAPKELDEYALGVALDGLGVGDATADVVPGVLRRMKISCVNWSFGKLVPVVLVPPDVQRKEPDEARDLHEEVDDDGEPRVEGERVDGRHCEGVPI